MNQGKIYIAFDNQSLWSQTLLRNDRVTFCAFSHLIHPSQGQGAPFLRQALNCISSQRHLSYRIGHHPEKAVITLMSLRSW